MREEAGGGSGFTDRWDSRDGFSEQVCPVLAACLDCDVLQSCRLCTGAGFSDHHPGELRIAVTRASSTDPYDSQLWIRKYLEKFAQEQALQIVWLEVPFSESWLLASRNEVDIVATNVASFADRQSAGASFSAPFLYERRALRIRPEDRSRYSQISDFVGSTIGVVRGMAAERDVDRRAVPGVNIRRTDFFRNCMRHLMQADWMRSPRLNITRSTVR